MADPLAKLRDRRLRTLNALVPRTRTCGDCDLCCTTLEVGVLNKPEYQRCSHQKTDCAGCAIYERRPRLCREFMCLWLISERWLGDEAHPHRLGGVLNWAAPQPGAVFVVTFVPTTKGDTSWQAHDKLLLLGEISDRLNCILAIGSGEDATHIIVPGGRLISRADNPQVFQGGSFAVPTEVAPSLALGARVYQPGELDHLKS